MSWLRHSEPPVVPDDREARKALIREETRRLAQVVNQGAEIIPLADSLRRHNERNHYAERLQEAYGMR